MPVSKTVRLRFKSLRSCQYVLPPAVHSRETQPDRWRRRLAERDGDDLPPAQIIAQAGNYGPLAQLVERLTVNQKRVGSSPTGIAKSYMASPVW